VTLCGELAGRPISAMALIGLGFRAISMAPASIGPVKAMLTELPLSKLEAFLAESLARPGAGRNTRNELAAFAHEHDIPL
jgi:phosphotransferase system enzyme I (PtsP)